MAKSSDSRSTDVWNVQSACPKVRSRCSKSSRLAPLDGFVVKKPSLDYTIDKLHKLITDPVTSNSKPWISRLLGDFLCDVSHDGYRLKDLTVVMEVLEFLARRVDIEEYEIHLEKMLELCKLAPLLEKTSDSLRCVGLLEKYFSTLGDLTMILSTDKKILKVLEALRFLLSKPAGLLSVKLQLCREAMEKSRLPMIITNLSEISSPEIYSGVLELVLVLATVSNTCCESGWLGYKMLKAGILDHLFVRINESERQRVLVSSGNASKGNVVLTTKIMWPLMQSILSLDNKLASGFEKLPGPSIKAMRSLRDAFQYQVCHSQRNIKSLILRNDLAALILAGLAALPHWHLVRCGLAEDLVVLSIGNDTGIEGTWTENVTFDPSNENLIFKQIMLTMLCYLSNRGPAIAIMAKRGVMPAILAMINPRIDHTTRWSPAQFWYLSQFAMRTLARLANKMPEEFTRNEGAARLLMLVEWSLTKEFDPRIMMELTKTICGIVVSKNALILTSFRGEGTVPTLMKLINRILSFGCLTMQHQRILTLLMTSIEEITRAESSFDSDDQSLDVGTELLRRCFYQKKEDFPLDQRLLVAIGSYIWKRVVPCPGMREKFVENGGIYTILDVIENACLPVRCVYLGIITDISSNRYASPHLSSWRGTDKSKGLVSLMAKCWREEEIKSGVKRTTEGRINDFELPIMGTEQWVNTFHARATYDSSPALASILGSVRPKIYSLRKIMTSEDDERSRERYKILLNDPPLEDHITMYIADHFYRFAQGQLWLEVSRYLEQVGVNILGMDGEILLLMNQRHRDWGMYVRGLQDKLLRAEKKRETERERDEIIRIRDSKLGSALSALRDIDYIRRTTERDYAIERKNFQRRSVNEALKFPNFSDDEHCHRTFNNNWNFTTIFEHNHTISSVPEKLDKQMTSLLVSPASSAFGKIQPSSIKFKDSVNSLSDGCLSTRIGPKKLMKRVYKINTTL